KQNISPYLSHFASMGLSRAAEVTGNKKYSASAWRWLRWYQSKMDAQGFVTDYRVENGIPVSNGFMDSTDSYAGMFLVAIRANYRVTRDNKELSALRAGIAKAVQAIEATQEADGLTWAKPSWRVKYLMDQAEAYAGLVAAADLATLLKDSALATRAQSDAERMKAGVESLWNAANGSFDWAKHDSGVTVANDWSFLYSDALQQAWAVAFGLVDRARGDSLMTRLNAAQPNWALPASTAVFSGGSTQTVGYWPVAGWAYASLTSALAPSAVTSIRSAAISADRAWPFTTGNAGQLIIFESYSPVSLVVTALPGFSLGVSVSLSADEASGPKTTTTTALATKTVTSSTTTTVAATALAAPAPTTTTTAPAAVPPPPTTTTVPATRSVLYAGVGPLQADLSTTKDGVVLSVGVEPLPPLQVQIGSGGNP
ncbi:MAG TPA: hypothetical protein VG795_11120, partial [Acidimicrobiia bacterium]|nr:hypothetical protein [Acidimicrobiia bacterium]